MLWTAIQVTWLKNEHNMIGLVCLIFFVKFFCTKIVAAAQGLIINI